jgi:hypothetical protein
MTNPCGVVVPPGVKMILTREDVIIVWDKDLGVEHFIRKAIFSGDQKDLGFLVPTPSIPELSLVNDRAFMLVESKIPHLQPLLGCSGGGDTGPATPPVEVLSVQQIGHYTATILKATNGADLNKWLATNSYESRPALASWLDSYAKKSWVFTAFKFVGGRDDPEIKTEAIGLSFKTDRPHYPYSRPSDSWQRGFHQPMNVFFISSTPVSALYDGTSKDWEAKVLWSGALSKGAVDGLSFDLKIDTMPKNAKLTIFDNGESAGDYALDLYFVPTNRIPTVFIVAPIVVLLVAWVLMRRRRKLPAS